MKKILITGSLGFVYSNFIRFAIYEKQPYQFITVDKATNEKFLANLYESKAMGSNYLADITDAHILNSIFFHEKPDLVINGAAESDVDYSITNPNCFVNTNVLGTQNIINACLKYNCRLLQQSTDEVYGALGLNDAPFTETAMLNPSNAYAASKASADLLVQAAGKTHDLDYMIVRSSNMYGNRQTTNKLIPRVIKSLIDYTPIPVYGDGLQSRSWLHVKDNYKAIIKLIDNWDSKSIYNVDSNQEFNNLKTINMICDNFKFGEDLITFVKDRLGHDRRYAMNCDKIKSLGWEPSIKFDNGGLSDACQWYRDNKYHLA